MSKEKESKTIKLNKNQTISLYQQKESEIRRISARLQEVDNIVSDIQKAENTLKEIQNIKSKEKIMINIGAGVLVPCEIENTKNVQVILPGSIIVNKTITDIVTDFEKRKKDLEDARIKLIQTYQQNAKTLQSIQNALQKMSASQKNSAPTNVN
jgi:prefoldin alpha subunit